MNEWNQFSWRDRRQYRDCNRLYREIDRIHASNLNRQFILSSKNITESE